MQLPLISKVNHPLRWLLGLLAVGTLTICSTAYLIKAKTTPKIDVDQLTVPVESKNLTFRITASGTVVPIQSVNISPKNAGRLEKLLVEQGDRVQQGQLIAIMDNREIQAQVQQARANWEQAKARLAEAQAGSRSEEVAQAQARLEQAQAKLAQARNGTRPEEVAQARSQVDAARARVGLTQVRVERYQALVKEGAIAQDQLDQAISEDRSAKANLQEVQRRLAQLESGSRREEIEQLQATVSEARYALAQVKNGTRPEQIQQLKAAADAAQAQLQSAQVQLDDTVIRAPFTGIVTQKYANEGAFVTPTTSASSTNSATSTSIVALAKDLEIKARVPEVDIGQIKTKQQVEIVADAYPDQVFRGRVRLVAPEAVVEQSVTSFEVRVAIETGQEKLRSGMNVNTTFLGKQVNDALVVPTVAIVVEKGKTGVLVLNKNNQPQFQTITIGSTVQDQTQILEGVKSGDRVFIDLPKDQQNRLKDQQ